MNSELVTNIYRIAEAKALEDKLAKEKKALEEYLKKVGQSLFCTFDCKIYHHPFQIQSQDALEHKQKMEAENKALKEKLDREASKLQKEILHVYFLFHFIFIGKRVEEEDGGR